MANTEDGDINYLVGCPSCFLAKEKIDERNAKRSETKIKAGDVTVCLKLKPGVDAASESILRHIFSGKQPARMTLEDQIDFVLKWSSKRKKRKLTT